MENNETDFQYFSNFVIFKTADGKVNEMLERVREIRLSERRLYQKITDIYLLSADYDSKADIIRSFF